MSTKAKAKGASGASKPKKSATKAKPAPKSGNKVVLLSGGNPQIAKGYGDEPVQAYIAAMPGSKSDLGKRIDALVTKAVPKVQKAVKWNSPFYGTQIDYWFLSLHCFNKYVKLTFFRGSSLEPAPPGLSKYPAVRYFDIREDDELDEKQLLSWIKQAAALPGEKM